MNWLDNALFDLNCRIGALIQRLKEEEQGATDIIAILVMIVVVIAVAMVFKDRLIGIVNAAFDKLQEVFS